ncbi:MAG TPA: hypothetical protein PKL90_09025, partial [Bacteroidales bacterium]|nr:hypothetical protein [Bacteroidales bacterium]
PRGQFIGTLRPIHQCPAANSSVPHGHLNAIIYGRQPSPLLLVQRTAGAAPGVNRIAACIGMPGAGDTSLPHLLVVTHMGVRELPSRFEKYGYSKTCQRKADQYG